MKSDTLSVVVLLCLAAYTSGQEYIAGLFANVQCYSLPSHSRFVATNAIATASFTTSLRGASSLVLCPPSIAALRGVTCIASTRVRLRDCFRVSSLLEFCPPTSVSVQLQITNKTRDECCWCCVVKGCKYWEYVDSAGICVLY